MFFFTDILYVTPSGGSTDGGTKITITVNTPLANYTDNIKVFVGGMKHTNIIQGTH